ncbi:MAG: hypothetical protein U0793_27095 [Gemmataceae bacterium]
MKHDRDDRDDDDHFLYAAEQLEAGHTVAEVRKMLISRKRVPEEESRSIVLNVYAAQKLQEGYKPSAVRDLLLQEKNVTPEEARAIVAELREATEEPAREESAPATGTGTMRGLGIAFLVLGIGSFILPLMGLQFRALGAFGQATPFIGAGLAVVGAVLLILSFTLGGAPPRRGKRRRR